MKNTSSEKINEVINFIRQKRQIIIVVFVSSIGFNLYVNKFAIQGAVGGIIFQLLGSFIIGTVFTSFLNTVGRIMRRKEFYWLNSWLILYILMVGLSIITVIFGLYPME